VKGVLTLGYQGAIALLAAASAINAATVPEPVAVAVEAGSFIRGSDQREREYAYRLDEHAYGHDRTRAGKWYDAEPKREKASTKAYAITQTPITNRQYQAFIAATNHPAPGVSAQVWKTYGLIHPYKSTHRFTWINRMPPAGREDHPVVLVSYHDAIAYAKWLSTKTGKVWRLPTENEWVKAARGTDGRIFPWGDAFDPDKLNSHDRGPFDTVAVGSRSHPSPYGLLDAAGQVFEWTHAPGYDSAWVKGGSWDDSGCGVCRPAARHSRPKHLKHILVGFRLVTDG
jgi:formylglycine-generating enzyme required for sulfatase activity